MGHVVRSHPACHRGRAGKGDDVNTCMPSRYQDDDTLRDAWEDGKGAAESDRAYSEAYGEPVSEPASPPVTYRNNAKAAEAFRDGYAVQMQELTDNR